jgi:hypothetical protein
MPYFTIALLTLSTNLAAMELGPTLKRAPVAELFEDDAEEFLKLLTNPGDAPGRGEAEAKVVFSGSKSIKISEYQRFHRKIPGWDFTICEKPKPGEFRYLRIAWKSEGANCMMLQLHDATDWNIRYTAGANPYGWATRFVSDRTPKAWRVVTIDLFKDFGDRKLTGIAFTIHSGVGYFDHVYLGRSIDDLDRIDANKLTRKKIALAEKELAQLWQDMAAEDAAVQYRAFWTLAAGREASAAFLKSKLTPSKAADAELKEWIGKLGAGSFVEREKATTELRKRLDAALPLLEAELNTTKSLEARRRIEMLIGESPTRDADKVRRVLARRILSYQMALQHEH